MAPVACAMPFFHQALEAETAGRWPEALAAYEQSNAAGENQFDAYLNLAYLYWDISYDYGMETHFLQSTKLPHTAVADFDDRWRRVLAEAIARFPDEPEPYFWRGYFTQESAYDDRPDPFLLAMPERWPRFDLAYLYRYRHGLRGEPERAALPRLRLAFPAGQTLKMSCVENMLYFIERFGM